MTAGSVRLDGKYPDSVVLLRRLGSNRAKVASGARLIGPSSPRRLRLIDYGHRSGGGGAPYFASRL